MEKSELARLETDLAALQTELNATDRIAASRLGVGSAQDLQVLRLLLRDGPTRVGVIASTQGGSVATVSARLERLERRGLLTRERMPGDRRAVAATLTDAGREAAEASREQRLGALRSLAEPLAQPLLDEVVAALSTLRRE